jgi:outer membrane protein
MDTNKLRALCIGAALALGAGAVLAQDNAVKAGVIYYTTHSSTSGIQGVGVPPGADAETGNAVTVLFTYERMLTPSFGIELVVGVPPKISANATGSVAFLGDDVLSARNVSPTLLFNYHFGAPGDTWRPYVGIGINYTRFVSIESTLASNVEMGDSWGPAGQVGVDYALTKDWSLFASVAALKVKSNLVATGATVLTTTIDLRPITYSFGVAYKF